MKHARNLATLLAMAGMLGFSGCTFLLVGEDAPGPTAASKDTAKLEIARTFDRSWSAAQDVIKKLGVITMEDKKTGKFKANVRDAKVAVVVARATPKTMRIEVKACKDASLRVDLSNEIIIKIQDQLK